MYSLKDNETTKRRKTMTRERRFELLAILSKIQNEPHNQNKDIMTITGFMRTEEEILEHIENHKKRD